MNNEIDYKELREVLEYQVKESVKNAFFHEPKPSDIDLIYDLCARTYHVFDYIYDEIVEDAELKKLFLKEDIDGIVNGILEHIIKHEGTIIPPPYEDIDDWWGDFNQTISYLAWDYKVGMGSNKRVKSSGLKEGGVCKCFAVVSSNGRAEKLGGFYTSSL